MLRLPQFNHIKPSSLDEALHRLQDCGSDVCVLAGGTDLLVSMKHGLLHPKTILSVRSLPGLSSIAEEGDGTMHIGAGVTLADLAGNRTVAEKIPALHKAAGSVASWHIRNMATLGGNICLPCRCWYYNQSKAWRSSRMPCHRLGGDWCHAIRGSSRCHAVNSADTAPALMALNARLRIMRQGRSRDIAIRDFYNDDGARHIMLVPGELITEVLVPTAAPGSRCVFMKECVRRGIDFATGSIAVFMKQSDGVCSEPYLVLNAFGSAPLVLRKTAGLLQHEKLTDALIDEAARTAPTELGTLTNLFTSAGYKRDLARALVRKALAAYTTMFPKPGRAPS